MFTCVINGKEYSFETEAERDQAVADAQLLPKKYTVESIQGEKVEIKKEKIASDDTILNPDFRQDAAESADVVSGPQPALDTDSGLEDGSLELPLLTEQEQVDLLQYDNKIYGNVLNKEGDFEYIEQPYQSQIDNYRISYNDALTAQGNFSYLENSSEEDRQYVADTMIPKPTYLKNKFNYETNSYEQVPTEEAAKAIEKNLPNNFSEIYSKEQFNNAIELGVAKTLNEDPLVNHMIKQNERQSKQELSDYAVSLSKKYNFDDPEELRKAEKDWENRAKQLIVDPVVNSKAYKNTVGQLVKVSSDVIDSKNIEFGRFKSDFLSSLDGLSNLNIPGSEIVSASIESVTKGGLGMKENFNNAQVGAMQVKYQKNKETLSRLEKDVENGTINENDSASFGGTYSNKEGYTIGAKKGTVKDKIEFLKKEIKNQTATMSDNLTEAAEARAFAGLMKSANLEDGIDLMDMVRLIGESAPQMAAATAGTLTGNPVLAGLGFMTMATTEYGSNYIGTVEQGLINDNIEVNQENILKALSEGKYANQAASVAGAALSASLESLGGISVASKTLKALGLSSNITKGAASLYKGEIKTFAKNLYGKGKTMLKGGRIEALTELGQGLTGQITKGVQLDGIGGFANYIDNNENYQSFVAGGAMGIFLPFAGAAVSQSKIELRNAARDVATKFDFQGDYAKDLRSVNTFFRTAENNLNERFALNELTEQEYKEELANLNESRNIGYKIPKELSETGRKKAFDLILEKTQIEKNIKGKEPELVVEEKNRILQINSELNDISNIDKGSKTAKKILKGVGKGNTQYISLGTKEEVKDWIKENTGKSEEEAVSQSTSYGLNVKSEGQPDIIIINEETIFESGKSGRLKNNTSAHEVLHTILNEAVGAEQMAKMGNELASAVKAALGDQYASSEFGMRYEQYVALSKEKDENGKPKYSKEQLGQEAFTLLSEALLDNKLNFDRTDQSFISKLKEIIKNVYANVIGKPIEFNTTEDLFDFIESYNKSITSGKGLSGRVKATIKKGAKGAITTKETSVSESKSQLNEDVKNATSDIINEIKALDAESQALADKFKKPFARGAKATRLEREVISNIKPTVDRLTTTLTKRLYDPIADDAKRNVSRQEFQDSLKDDLNTMTINEYKSETNGKKNDLEKFISNRGFLRAQNLAKRLGIKSVEEGIDSDVTSIKDLAADEAVETVAKDIKQIKASSILNPEQTTKAKDLVNEWAENTDLSKQSFKSVPNLIADIIAEVFNVPVKKIINPKANLNKVDSKAAQMAMVKIGNKLKNLLPEGAVLGAANERLIGTSTGVPKAMLDAFYTKNERLGKKQGLFPYTLNKDITTEDILAAMGILDGKQSLSYSPRSKEAQVLKGMMNLLGKLVTNEFVRTETDASANIKQNIAAGKSELMYSLQHVTPKLLNELNIGDVNNLKTLNVRNKTDLAKAIQKLEDELYPAYFDKLKPYIEGFKEDWEISQKAKWPDSEQRIIDTFVNLKKLLPNLKIVQTKLNKNSNELDYKFELDGKEINLEAKKNLSARLGSLGIHFNETQGFYINSKHDGINGKFLGKLIAGEKNTANVFIDKAKDYYNGKFTYISYDKSGKRRFKMKEWAYAKLVAQGLLIESTSKVKLPIEYVSQFYANKNGDVINFGDIGAFAIKNNGMFDIPLLNQKNVEVEVTVSWKPSYLKNGNVVLTRVASPQLTTDSKKILSKTNTFNFSKLKEAQAILNTNNIKTLNNETLISPSLRIEGQTNTQVIDQMIKIDKAITIANSLDVPNKGISVWDFDDTLAKSKSNVLYTMPGDIITNEKDFYNEFIAAHKDLRSKNKNQTKKLILKNGFDQSNNVNALPIFKGYDKSTDVISTRYQKYKKGDIVYLLNSEGITEGANGYKVKKGYKPKASEIITITKDGQNVFEAWSEQNFPKKKLTAEQFAKEGDRLMAEGAKFDFSEFSKVVQGSKGPFFEKAMARNKKFGNKNVFILTARPANSATAIHEFLKGIGLDIPLANITGLANSSPQAKANWVVGKAAEGYNDFYFADDHIGNVKAVEQALSVLDVKSKVQQARISSSLDMSKEFNKYLEGSTGIESFKKYKSDKARLKGRFKGKFDVFIPPSAEDFLGLLYQTLNKGELGNAQMKFYEDNLLKPYAKANSALRTARVRSIKEFAAIKKKLKVVPKDLKRSFKFEDENGNMKDSLFTKEQAIRVYIWNSQGIEMPNLSQVDLAVMVNHVNANPELKTFADELLKLNRGMDSKAPSKNWMDGNIGIDLQANLNSVGRKQLLEVWQQNVNAIFSEENLNKLEAAYGPEYVKALKSSLRRMRTGRSSVPVTDNEAGNNLITWLNSAVGNIMFFNNRSALLQMLSATNFLNFEDNNIIAAGKAFANQKQYWKDFTMLMNSDYLLDRRDGTRININEADIALIAKQSGIQGVIAKILEAGFLPTKFADSLAIATGGATFYRTKINALIKGGMSKAKAEAQAMQEFISVAEISQQSSDQSKISMEQAGSVGKIILAFNNTSSQYSRIIKRSVQDLYNRRGSDKANLAKIIYYGGMQNLVFNFLQQAMFAAMWGGEDDEEVLEGKKAKVVNSMADGLLRGMGVKAAIFVAIKNTAIKLFERSKRDRGQDYRYYAVMGMLAVSPPLSSKASKLSKAASAYEYGKDKMEYGELSLDSPELTIGANLVSFATSLPTDRLLTKAINVSDALDSSNEPWERLFMTMGWPKWTLSTKAEIDEERTVEKAKIKAIKEKEELDAMTPLEQKTKALTDLKKFQQIDSLKAYGLTDKEIKLLTREEDRVNKILSLEGQEKKGLSPTDAAEEELYDLKKQQQVDSLTKYGLSKKQIRLLKYEEDRVKAIIRLQKKKRKDSLK